MRMGHDQTNAGTQDASTGEKLVPDEIDLDEILVPGTATELLSKLRGEHEKLDDISGKAARRAMVHAYQIAVAARHSDDVWLEICSNQIWHEKDFRNRPKAEDRANALQFAIRLSVGFRGPPDNSIVSKRYVAMRPSFEREQPVAVVKELLKEHGGAEGLAAWEKAQTKPEEKKAPEEVVVLRISGPGVQHIRAQAFSDFKLEILVTERRGKTIQAVAREVTRYVRLPPKGD